MQSLNSKNYDSVIVKVRDQDAPIVMDTKNGTALMDYLVSQHGATHVGVTDLDGNRVIIKTTDILRVEPSVKLPEVQDYV